MYGIIFQADTFLIANWILWLVKSLRFWGLHVWVQTTVLYSINMKSQSQVITKYSHFAFLKCLHEQCNKLHLLNKNRQVWVAGLGLVQSHPLHRMCFRQCQASSAVLGWPGDGDRYLVHNIQSSDWPYLYEHGVSLCRYLLIGECMTIHAARGVSSTIISRNDVYATCVWV